jgi:hypothetical protein
VPALWRKREAKMSEQRMMKVARCKTCGKIFHASIWPIEHPSEDLTMSVRLNNYGHIVDSQMEFDQHILDGDIVTIEPHTDEPISCRCH